MRFGFEDLGIENIIGVVHPENIASQRVLVKAGLTWVERANYFGMDVYRYLMSRSEWDEIDGMAGVVVTSRSVLP